MQRVPISRFIKELEAAYLRGDGYIMGAYGQNPRLPGRPRCGGLFVWHSQQKGQHEESILRKEVRRT